MHSLPAANGAERQQAAVHGGGAASRAPAARRARLARHLLQQHVPVHQAPALLHADQDQEDAVQRRHRGRGGASGGAAELRQPVGARALLHQQRRRRRRRRRAQGLLSRALPLLRAVRRLRALRAVRAIRAAPEPRDVRRDELDASCGTETRTCVDHYFVRLVEVEDGGCDRHSLMFTECVVKNKF